MSERWPEGAVEKAVCANCGAEGFAFAYAPPRGDGVAFERWLRSVWPDGRCQHTRLGFYAWCSAGCERLWKQTRARALEYEDTAQKQHRREMDRRRLKAGL